MRSLQLRIALGAALLIGLSPTLTYRAPQALAQDRNKDIRQETLTGKVVPLADLVAKLGTKLDDDAVATSLVLVTDEGKYHPLIKDAGARMFFKDEKLLRRPVRAMGRILPGGSYFQILSVHGLVKGQPYELYYWCDICSIKRFEKMICECCGGPMDFREEALKK